jgi:hypothetical protein
LRQAFRDSIDDYLAFCEARGEEPEKPFSGKFVTRISPALHRKITLLAHRSRQSVNAWIAKQLERFVAAIESSPHLLTEDEGEPETKDEDATAKVRRMADRLRRKLDKSRRKGSDKRGKSGQPG